MIYILTDSKDKSFRVTGRLENIHDFLDYSDELGYVQTKYRLAEDPQYQNEVVSYSLEESGVHVAERESGTFVADVYDILQGLAVIEMFETEDDSGKEYEPGSYDIVDDMHRSLL